MRKIILIVCCLFIMGCFPQMDGPKVTPTSMEHSGIKIVRMKYPLGEHIVTNKLSYSVTITCSLTRTSVGILTADRVWQETRWVVTLEPGESKTVENLYRKDSITIVRAKDDFIVAVFRVKYRDEWDKETGERYRVSLRGSG